MKKNNNFYNKLAVLIRIVIRGIYSLFFWRNKEKPNEKGNKFLVSHEKSTTTELSEVVTVAVAEQPDTISDEVIWKEAEKLDALKEGEITTKAFIIKEANAELAKLGTNRRKLTEEDELVFQELEKAIHCKALVNAEAAYVHTYPIALLSEAYKAGLLSDNVFCAQLALRYTTIPYSYFLKKVGEVIVSLEKPEAQRTLAHYIEIAEIIYEKVKGEFFYSAALFLERCEGIKREVVQKMDMALEQRLMALRDGRQSDNSAELARRTQLAELGQRLSSQEGRQSANESPDELILPEVPNMPISARNDTANVLANTTTTAQKSEIVATREIATKTKVKYYGVSEMTAAFLRAFIPNPTTRSKLLKPLRLGDVGNNADLHEIIENSSFVNRDPHSKIKSFAGNVQPEIVIERFRKVVDEAAFKNRELLLTEKVTQKERDVSAKAMIEALAKTLSELEKSSQPIAEDYQLLRDNCLVEEQFNTYFNSAISELDNIIKGYADEHSSAYKQIKQELEKLQKVAEAETDKSLLQIYSKPYWTEQESLQAMQDFLSAEYQRLNLSPYKSTTPQFRQVIHINLYKEYNSAYESVMQHLGCKPLAEDVQRSIVASATQELTLKPLQIQKTSPHFFHSLGKTAGKVGLTLGSIALSVLS